MQIIFIVASRGMRYCTPSPVFVFQFEAGWRCGLPVRSAEITFCILIDELNADSFELPLAEDALEICISRCLEFGDPHIAINLQGNRANAVIDSSQPTGQVKATARKIRGCHPSFFAEGRPASRSNFYTPIFCGAS